MPEVRHVRLFVAIALAIALDACSQQVNCTTDEQAADHLAKFAADVQSASLRNKLSSEKLKELSIRLDTAGSHYSARKDPIEFCKDIDAISKDFPEIAR